MMSLDQEIFMSKHNCISNLQIFQEKNINFFFSDFYSNAFHLENIVIEI